LKSVATWIRECDEVNFARVFSHYPDVRFWNARTETIPSPIAGLLLTGGSDISEPFLRQPVPDPKLIEDALPSRDEWEFPALARALEKRLPIFAICRGLQVLNVALGGTLVLDIPGHDGMKYDNVQPVRYAPGVPIQFPKVNSSHHQALDRLGNCLEVEGWCVEDDVIEQARLLDYPFALGVQYHPERDPMYQPLFDAFVANLSAEVAWP
jgi:putative glutamine amidotransferase